MRLSGSGYASLAAEVRRAQAGEPEAFRNLVVRFQDMAVGYAFSLLGDYHLAEDAAQEAFLAAFRDVRQLCHPEAFVGWLRTVVFKHCDRVRRRQPVTEPLDANDARLVADSAEPADALAQLELARLVGQTIRSLPAHQREAVSLYYIGERSGRQVATFLDLPLTTVKKRLHDAKPALRRKMRDMARQFLEDHRPSRDASFADRVLRLAAPERDKDAPAIYSLFEAEDHPARDQWRAGRLADSHADWGVSRIALAGDGDVEQPLAALLAYGLTMRVGAAEVTVAGINGDVLHPDAAEQRDDILGRAATASVDAMRDAGYDLAVAFDDESFWLRHGFALGWRALAWRVSVADLPTGPVPNLEHVEACHRDDLAAVCNATHAGLTGTARRPTYRRNKHPGLFRTLCWGDPASGYVSVDPEGDGDCLWADEVAGDAGTCLAVLRSVAETRECSELFFDRLHYKSPVGVRLRQMASCRLATGTRLGRARWYVVRIVNLESVMTKLAPVFRRRLLDSELADWRGRLSIRLHEGDTSQAVTLRVRDGGIAVQDGPVGPNTICGGQAIVQLLLGVEDAVEVVAANGIELQGEAARLLPVLFPPQHPQMENQAL